MVLSAVKPERERELVVKSQQGDREAQTALLHQHRGFIFRVARRFASDDNSIDDLAQEGRIALLRAIEDFDLSRETRLLTYAGYRIQHRVQQAAWRSSSILRRPGTGPSSLSSACMEYAQREVFSLDYRPNGESPSLHSIIPDAFDIDDVVDRMDTQSEVSLLYRAIAALDPRRQGIIRDRMAGITLDQISQRVNVTRERVRQLEGQAHRMIRSFMLQNQKGHAMHDPEYSPLDALRALSADDIRQKISEVENDLRMLRMLEKAVSARDGRGAAKTAGKVQRGKREAVLAFVREHGPSTVPEIVAGTGVSKATVYKVLNGDQSFSKQGDRFTVA